MAGGLSDGQHKCTLWANEAEGRCSRARLIDIGGAFLRQLHRYRRVTSNTQQPESPRMTAPAAIPTLYHAGMLAD